MNLNVYLMLLGSSRPYHWLILEEYGRKTDDDDRNKINEIEF